mgnify:CR=1 FL=1
MRHAPPLPQPPFPRLVARPRCVRPAAASGASSLGLSAASVLAWLANAAASKPSSPGALQGADGGDGGDTGGGGASGGGGSEGGGLGGVRGGGGGVKKDAATGAAKADRTAGDEVMAAAMDALEQGTAFTADGKLSSTLRKQVLALACAACSSALLLPG